MFFLKKNLFNHENFENFFKGFFLIFKLKFKEFNQNGLITKSKKRRLLLLNDLIVCVSVAKKHNNDFCINNERLKLKWTHPVSDLEIVDSSLSPTLSRILNSNRGGSLKSNSTCNSLTSDSIGNEMNSLMHDFEVMSRVNDLVSTLHKVYDDITVENCRNILTSIQVSHAAQFIDFLSLADLT